MYPGELAHQDPIPSECTKSLSGLELEPPEPPGLFF